MVGTNSHNQHDSFNISWVVVPGYYHEGHPILRQPATGDLAFDGLQDPYPIALPPAVEADIRARLAS